METIVIEAETHYDILENEDNELLVAIKARDGATGKPHIVYAGGEHAIFYRNDKLTILLDYIHPEVRANFRKAASVLMVEFQDGSIIREYVVPVKQLSNLPMADDEIQRLLD